MSSVLTIPHDNPWACLRQLGVPPQLQQVVKAMYIAIYAKIQLIGDTHVKVMSNIGVKQGCPLFPTLFGL